MNNHTITAIPGLLVGHATDTENHTGCTAILCPEGFTPGLAVPGFAPGTRETELLRPESTVGAVHGLLFSGGSAFGLSAADGVVRFLKERGHGLPMPHGCIPLVPAAVIYDLDMNARPGFLPDADMGYRAAGAAAAEPLPQGSLGAGSGARSGRLFAFADGVGRAAGTPEVDYTSKSGLGSSLVTHNGIMAGALVVLNPLGNVYDPLDGSFVSGGRKPSGESTLTKGGKVLDGTFSNAEMRAILAGGSIPESNTILVAVTTNAPLSKTQASRFARMAAAGIGRCVFPAHLPFDGDAVFALASKVPLPEGAEYAWSEALLGAMGAEAVAGAILNAARLA